jgi:hypothetical protein
MLALVFFYALNFVLFSLLVCVSYSLQFFSLRWGVAGLTCTENCHGRMTQEYTDSALHTQLKCLEALFDVGRLQAKKKWGDKVYVYLLGCFACLLACLLGVL